MIPTLLNKFNTLRKEKHFKSPLYQTKLQYAFIGVGMHSLQNLYPVLRHFGIQLKYIHTERSNWQQQMQALFPGCKFTHNINDILEDTAVAGIFVCTRAEAHFGLLVQLINAGKKIFIEKPPCHTLPQLTQLINLSRNTICKVGLQRRYWAGNKFLVGKSSRAQSYTYQFHFGPYLQGDPFAELFIHALDYCQYLFGHFVIQSVTKHGSHNNVMVQMHVLHNNKISGLIELSTQFSWNAPKDYLQINLHNELLKVQYPLEVEGIQKPQRILNIPTERLLQRPVVIKKHFSTGNLIIPSAELNTLVLQGFCGELEAFIQLTEQIPGISDIAPNDLPSLLPVYQAIEKIREA